MFSFLKRLWKHVAEKLTRRWLPPICRYNIMLAEKNGFKVTYFGDSSSCRILAVKGDLLVEMSCRQKGVVGSCTTRVHSQKTEI